MIAPGVRPGEPPGEAAGGNFLNGGFGGQNPAGKIGKGPTGALFFSRGKNKGPVPGEKASANFRPGGRVRQRMALSE